MDKIEKEKKDEASRQLILLGAEGAAAVIGGALSFFLDAYAKEAGERFIALQESRRQKLRDIINNGEQVSLHEMSYIVNKVDLTKEQIAEEIGMSVESVKKAIKPWWKLF